MGYLLDTNVLSHVIRHPSGDIASRIDELDERDVFTSIVVAGELRFGAVKSGSQRLAANVDDLLEGLRTEPLEAPSDVHYAVIRAYLQRQGTPIRANDMLIAAHALATDSILVTDNVKEFSRVPGLKIENWLR